MKRSFQKLMQPMAGVTDDFNAATPMAPIASMSQTQPLSPMPTPMLDEQPAMQGGQWDRMKSALSHLKGHRRRRKKGMKR